MQPANFSRSSARISAGSRQWLVGPASASDAEQMNVRSSTRATSPGSDSARYEFGRLASLRRSKVPASTSSWAMRSYSSAEPSHQWIESGCVSSATSSTQSSSFLLVVGALVVSIVTAGSTSLSWPKGEDRALCHTRRNPGGTHSTSPSAGVAPASLRGTSTSRLNSATSTPSWLSTRVCTLTVPRSFLDREGLTSSTSDSQKSVSPWKTGAGCLSSSVARLAIALPETSLTLIPSAREYTSGPTTTLRPCWLWPA